MIKARPYKLFNKIQTYDWGTINEDAFIPALLGIEAEKNLPYAELWIGAHPKAPSEIIVNESRIPLNIAIENFPDEILGKYVHKKFGNKLPFLLKVLSAARALSIQTHPNKEQAKYLHIKDPVNYPDDNHKPEIAVAIDSLTAIAGFRPVNEIVENIKKNPELEIISGKEFINKIINENSEKGQTNFIKELYTLLMKKAEDKELLKKVIVPIIHRLSTSKKITQEEEQFLKQYKNFGADVGLLSFFFFNIINLQPGQAIFTNAGTPHAYIEGNIIECMANSDNVVRAGLTNKFKDVTTLLNVLRYDFNKYKIINEEQEKGEVIFKTPAEEFQLTLFEKPKGFTNKFAGGNKPLFVLVMKGSLKIRNTETGSGFSETYKNGEAFFTPAVLAEFNLTCAEDSQFVIVEIPSA